MMHGYNGLDLGPPQTRVEARKKWMQETVHQTASGYRSYIANNLSVNTIHNMLRPENLAKADTDFSGTIDPKEFRNLLVDAGVDSVSAGNQSALLFSEADKDGDGELTVEEIKSLVEFKIDNGGSSKNKTGATGKEYQPPLAST